MYKILLRPILFYFDPEKVHYFVCGLLKIISKIPFGNFILRQIYQFENPALEREVFGLKFKNPVGLAAGFDKNAELIDEFSELGFGFIEIGTVTPLPQDGNDKPRLFRLPADKGIINRMGFNNKGMVEAAKRLRQHKSKLLIGGNIGKNKLTPNENALDDYIKCFDELHDVVDYFVVNVSSPNTPNLRDLQEKEPLMKILTALRNRKAPPAPEGGAIHRQLLQNKEISPPGRYATTHNSQLTTHNSKKPILLKIAPDLTDGQLDDIIEIVIGSGIDGVIATNTTISRANLETDASEVQEMGAGGLSGKPLTNRSTEVIRYLSEKSNRAFPIIGVGGIHSPEDALEKLRAGASLIQLYTGFIYEGPGLIKQINKSILKNVLVN